MPSLLTKRPSIRHWLVSKMTNDRKLWKSNSGSVCHCKCHSPDWYRRTFLVHHWRTFVSLTADRNAHSVFHVCLLAEATIHFKLCVWCQWFTLLNCTGHAARARTCSTECVECMGLAHWKQEKWFLLLTFATLPGKCNKKEDRQNWHRFEWQIQ